jgi:hypothetical protein
MVMVLLGDFEDWVFLLRDCEGAVFLYDGILTSEMEICVASGASIKQWRMPLGLRYTE